MPEVIPDDVILEEFYNGDVTANRVLQRARLGTSFGRWRMPTTDLDPFTFRPRIPFNTADMRMYGPAKKPSKKMDADKAEHLRKLSIPIKVRMEKITENSTTYYFIRARREDEIIDEYRETDKVRALSIYNGMVRDYIESATSHSWSNNEDKEVLKVDLRGEELSRNIMPRRPGRVDRRGRRPEDDIVSEDGLVLDIKEDLPEVKKINPVLDEFPELPELDFT